MNVQQLNRIERGAIMDATDYLAILITVATLYCVWQLDRGRWHL